jgi:hypothetical protein
MPIAFIAGTDEQIKAGKGELLLTTTQAAARLGMNERRLRMLVEQNVLTPYDERIFNVPLFVAKEIEQLRESRLKRGY